ncbi:hypothetical protein F5Y14DRAFT_420475 [Nemania sp. NC0429]|nr:hypothetical protein F5Y14DRAFT_420475 [Nemania sp. NC0429]
MILSEDPLFVIRKPHADITEEDVVRAFTKLPASQKAVFALLRDNAFDEFRSMEYAFAENSFNMAGEDAGGHQLDGPRGLFVLQSRFNHSCAPNSKIPIGSTGAASLQCFATKAIETGQEITFCYQSDLQCMTREERHRELRFTCSCEVCQLEPTLQRLSDMRRRLIRGLQYLQHGKDLNGKKQEASERPLITDRRLRIAAETCNIPLSSRLIYSLLSIVLIEQEGLLDSFLAERLSPGVMAAASMFQNEYNARVATLAMAQGTWLRRLCVAFHLYGQSDTVDLALAEALRYRENILETVWGT